MSFFYNFFNRAVDLVCIEVPVFKEERRSPAANQEEQEMIGLWEVSGVAEVAEEEVFRSIITWT